MKVTKEEIIAALQAKELVFTAAYDEAQIEKVVAECAERDVPMEESFAYIWLSICLTVRKSWSGLKQVESKTHKHKKQKKRK